jgi:BASS family bile acid:Na+ symporter
MLAMSANIIRLFPLLAVLASLLAWQQPGLFIDGKFLIVPLLSLVMFGMGLTLRIEDFQRVLRLPGLIALGLLLQYSVMPLTALLISRLFQLGPELTIGMILVGSCPGGTASNVICYLARGNVALSISLTAFSTLLSVFLTPLITLLLVDTSIEVPAEKMLFSIFLMVIIPVMLGTIINQLFAARIAAITPLFPAISVTAIILIIAIIIALNAGSLAELGTVLVFAVALHNLVGLVLGYFAARALRHDPVTCRTVAIEVGMQNSGLAVALAFKYFSAATALPGAIFSIWHNLSGAALASLWSRQSGSPAGSGSKIPD